MHGRTPTEHQEQKTLVQGWWPRVQRRWPGVLLYAIPNGGDRNPIVAKKLKAEGVLAGIPDLYLACPSWDSDRARPLHGLY